MPEECDMRNRLDVAAKRWAMALVVAWGLAGNAAATFINQGNGVILDTTTNLEWQQNAPVSFIGWNAAVNYANNLPLAGGGWRLPSLLELRGLYNELVDEGLCSGANCAGLRGEFSLRSVVWSADLLDAGRSFSFGFFDGRTQTGIILRDRWDAMAVRAGSVAVVPEPYTYALLLAGLGLLGWRTRRR
jgi:PEP-CTERM motif